MQFKITAKEKQFILNRRKSLSANKPEFGSDAKFNYVVKINNLDANDFFLQPFGRQISDLRKAQQFMKEAKTAYVDAKGKKTIPEVKKWIKENKPNEFYARWQKDSSFYKDDSVTVYYK